MIDAAIASPACTSRDRSAARELWRGIWDLVAMPGGALSAGNTRLVAAAAALDHRERVRGALAPHVTRPAQEWT